MCSTGHRRYEFLGCIEILLFPTRLITWVCGGRAGQSAARSQIRHSQIWPAPPAVFRLVRFADNKNLSMHGHRGAAQRYRIRVRALRKDRGERHAPEPGDQLLRLQWMATGPLRFQMHMYEQELALVFMVKISVRCGFHDHAHVEAKLSEPTLRPRSAASAWASPKTGRRGTSLGATDCSFPKDHIIWFTQKALHLPPNNRFALRETPDGELAQTLDG